MRSKKIARYWRIIIIYFFSIIIIYYFPIRYRRDIHMLYKSDWNFCRNLLKDEYTITELYWIILYLSRASDSSWSVKATELPWREGNPKSSSGNKFILRRDWANTIPFSGLTADRLLLARHEGERQVNYPRASSLHTSRQLITHTLRTQPASYTTNTRGPESITSSLLSGPAIPVTILSFWFFYYESLLLFYMILFTLGVLYI